MHEKCQTANARFKHFTHFLMAGCDVFQQRLGLQLVAVVVCSKARHSYKLPKSCCCSRLAGDVLRALTLGAKLALC